MALMAPVKRAVISAGRVMAPPTTRAVSYTHLDVYKRQPRAYEVTYLLGLLAGALTRTDRVGYVAPHPVYGVPAALNAFAQGLKTVRPQARVVLRAAGTPYTGWGAT